MELTMQERKKLTLVEAQRYVKASKVKKSAMLDDFCESTGYQRTYAARVLHQAGQRYVVGETILVADPGKRIHRYRVPWYGPRCAAGTDQYLGSQHVPWSRPSGRRDGSLRGEPDQAWASSCR